MKWPTPGPNRNLLLGTARLVSESSACSESTTHKHWHDGQRAVSPGDGALTHFSRPDCGLNHANHRPQMQKMYYFTGNRVAIFLHFAAMRLFSKSPPRRETTTLRQASRMAGIAWCIFGFDDHACYLSKA
jgi:hypothetical protein